MSFLRKYAVAGVLTLLLAAALDVAAAPPPISVSASSGDDQEASQGLFGFVDGINRSQALLGDMWGLRTKLSKIGVTLAIQDVDEYLGNVSGGTSKGFKYDGLTQVLLQMDTNRAFGLYGGLFNVSGFNIRGKNLSATNLGNGQDPIGLWQTVSGIEAEPTTRLWEMWYDQKFLEEDRLDVKIGQQSLDQEFMVSTNALYFVNTMFGWAAAPSYNMPSGGPAYPMSALGLRFAARPVNGVQILAGVFNGSPCKFLNGSTDCQYLNLHGTNFALGQGVTSIAEVQFSYPSLGAMVSPGDRQPLGWTYKIGGWYNSQSFDDQLNSNAGQSLAACAAATGGDCKPQSHRGNYSIYAVADQLIWRDDDDPNRTLGFFARVMGAPSDRNLLSMSANLGLVMHSPFKYRAADTFGIGLGWVTVSPYYAQNVANSNIANGISGPRPTTEQIVELTYQYQFKPWIMIQPDIQYIHNPGGGAQNPYAAPGVLLKNELVMGVRTIINF